jgi:hypothetical protein
MGKQLTARMFHGSDAELSRSCSEVAVYIVRDSTDFATRGISAASVQAFRDKASIFEDLPTDAELLGDAVTATEKKDALRSQLDIMVRRVKAIAADAYSEKGKYKRFGFNRSRRQDDNTLWRFSRRVKRVATELLPDMMASGLTLGVLTALEDLTMAFDESLDAQQDAICNRENGTEERVLAANILHVERMRLCNIGKNLYQDTSEARYNDYVIYDAPPAPAPPPFVP